MNIFENTIITLLSFAAAFALSISLANFSGVRISYKILLLFKLFHKLNDHFSKNNYHPFKFCGCLRPFSSGFIVCRNICGAFYCLCCLECQCKLLYITRSKFLKIVKKNTSLDSTALLLDSDFAAAFASLSSYDANSILQFGFKFCF